MPFVLWRSRQFPAHCFVMYKAGPIQGHDGVYISRVLAGDSLVIYP